MARAIADTMNIELKDVTLVEHFQEHDNELGGDGLVLPPVERMPSSRERWVYSPVTSMVTR